MAKSSKPRKKYVPKKIIGNPVSYAIEGAGKLPETTRAMMREDFARWIGNLSQGVDQLDAWKSLRDLSDVAGELSKMGIASDDESVDVICRGEQVLADLWNQYRTRKTWTMRADQLQALRDLAERHLIQAMYVSVQEFERAWQSVKRARIAFKAGSVPSNAIVLESAA